MRKPILLTLIVVLLAACQNKGADGLYDDNYGKYNHQGQVVTPIETTPAIRYLYHARVEACFYYASEWRVPPSSSQALAGTMVLQPIACSDKLRTVAETIGAAEVAAHTKTAP